MTPIQDSVISTILKHDRKISSYKIALLRAINETALSFPALDSFGLDIAVPLPLLAQYWIAYYWPFVDPNAPVWQGQRAADPRREGQLRNDIAFRPALTRLRQQWEQSIDDNGRPSDGFFLIHELRLARKAAAYPDALRQTYRETVKAISKAIEYPIQYAGPGQWAVFPKPVRLDKITRPVTAVPGAKQTDKCLIIPVSLWETFRTLSLWIEALCIHEWSLYTERLGQENGVDRGAVYALLTDRPDNRRPLSWERNQIDILLMEGASFACPWTDKRIQNGVSYDLDHLLPLAVYPTNELWNLLPSDPDFNRNIKRDRLPSTKRLTQSQPHLTRAYTLYRSQNALATALQEDVAIRFSGISTSELHYADAVSHAVTALINHVAASRNLARF